MMGHRGCRLAVSYPEIAEMQTTAIINAALKMKKAGNDIVPEIMIPLVGTARELAEQKAIVLRVHGEVQAKKRVEIPLKVGTMIEVPRGALTADEIAREAEFFSFGTNDLTQMTWGYSRDDAGRFIHRYVEDRILAHDPFVTIDADGVGRLVRIAAEGGRRTRPDIKLGICGEHGGDPKSIELCHELGLSYVSCSPFRVPIARLAAAQAAVQERRAAAPAQQRPKPPASAVAVGPELLAPGRPAAAVAIASASASVLPQPPAADLLRIASAAGSLVGNELAGAGDNDAAPALADVTIGAPAEGDPS